MSTTDASLAARAGMISLGERVAFEQLYAEQYPSMLRLAHALVDTREQAEEVVQDSFAAIYASTGSTTRPPTSARRWSTAAVGCSAAGCAPGDSRAIATDEPARGTLPQRCLSR